MRILGIETSCDDTAAAVIENGAIIHSNVVLSQDNIHAKFGGIVLLLTGIAILSGQLQVLGFFILEYFPSLGNIG